MDSENGSVTEADPLPADLLPEVASVYWRPRASEATLTRSAHWWTFVTITHTVPLAGIALGLALLNPITIPVGIVLLAHAWIIPELYAARGANVVRRGATDGSDSERTALGLLADLVGHDARLLLARSGLALERGVLGVWVVGEAGAVLVRPGGSRVHCYCVKATGDGLPPSDRIAHLLLALRSDEAGFATVANLAFSGASWRLNRRLKPPARVALDAARVAARA